MVRDTKAVQAPALVALNRAGAGLGNRLRMTLSAEVIANAEGRSFYYTWPTGDLFGCGFTELWKYSGGERLSTAKGKSIAQGRRVYTRDDIRKGLRSGDDVLLVESWHALPVPANGPTWEDVLRRLELRHEIADEVRSAHERSGGGPWVGVQVRASERTHAKTREASPVEWFEARMSDFIERDRSTRFFLSCDVPEVQKQLLERFPSAWAIQDKGGYNDRRGLKAAVVDLYLLSASTYLLAPYWSSFVEMSWFLSNRAQAMETSQELFPGGSVATYAPDPLRPADRAPCP